MHPNRTVTVECCSAQSAFRAPDSEPNCGAGPAPGPRRAVPPCPWCAGSRPGAQASWSLVTVSDSMSGSELARLGRCRVQWPRQNGLPVSGPGLVGHQARHPGKTPEGHRHTGKRADEPESTPVICRAHAVGRWACRHQVAASTQWCNIVAPGHAGVLACHTGTCKCTSRMARPCRCPNPMP